MLWPGPAAPKHFHAQPIAGVPSGFMSWVLLGAGGLRAAQHTSTAGSAEVAESNNVSVAPGISGCRLFVR